MLRYVWKFALYALAAVGAKTALETYQDRKDTNHIADELGVDRPHKFAS